MSEFIRLIEHKIFKVNAHRADYHEAHKAEDKQIEV
jgi:hypothetical protein